MFIYQTQKKEQYYDKVIEARLQNGYSVRRLAKIFPLSKHTIERWIANFAEDNPEVLIMGKRTVKRQPVIVEPEPRQQLPDDVKALQAELAKVKEELRKSWRQTVETLHAKDAKTYQVLELCRLFGVSKQAYYQRDENIALRRAAQRAFALQFIRDIREKDPGIGGVKLWYMYQRDFQGNDPIGRDQFVDIINEYGLKVRLKVRKPRTTDSTHGLPTYPNIIKDFIPTAPNQLWVSDITYITIWLDEYTYIFCYLSLILDAYTEEIVGWSIGPTLETTYPVEALRMALTRIEGMANINLIHHSDRGCQYASAEYVKLLLRYGIRISMTESGDPKDNAQAERINNTMKNELLKGMRFTNIDDVWAAVGRAVDFYNNERPHMSIDMKTPAEAALCVGEIPKCWTSYRENAIRAKQTTWDIPENTLPLCIGQGSPSRLRPPVNP